MLIYSDWFNNGWNDSWSWMPRYATNNPVYAGSNAMACVPSGQFQARWLKSGASVDATIYTNLSFRLNGGAIGGQSISVIGELNGFGLRGISVTAPTDSWKQVIISLAALGVNKTNLTGFQFGIGTSTQPFFIDDLRLIAAPTPATVHVSVNASQAVRTANEHPHQRPWHELGQPFQFVADESVDGAVEYDNRRGVFPSGAALLATHRGIREHLNPN